jgi:predicted kinase
MIVTFVGISGSGKSRLSAQFAKTGAKVINPDAIRKELTGDISDQSRNGEVFHIAHRRLDSHLKLHPDVDVVFDATNLELKSLKTLAEIAESNSQRLFVYVLTDSLSVDTCLMRINRDLQKGIDRAATNKRELLERMLQKFKNVIAQLDSWAEKNPHVCIVEYKAF